MKLEETMIKTSFVLCIEIVNNEMEVKVTFSLYENAWYGISLELLFLFLETAESQLLGALHKCNIFIY